MKRRQQVKARPARLPPMGGEFQYFIKSQFEEHERAASERELRPVQAYT